MKALSLELGKLAKEVDGRREILKDYTKRVGRMERDMRFYQTVADRFFGPSAGANGSSVPLPFAGEPSPAPQWDLQDASPNPIPPAGMTEVAHLEPGLPPAHICGDDCDHGRTPNGPDGWTQVEKRPLFESRHYENPRPARPPIDVAKKTPAARTKKRSSRPSRAKPGPRSRTTRKGAAPPKDAKKTRN